MELISGELDSLVRQLEIAQDKHEAAARRLAELPAGDPSVTARQREYFEADWSFHLAILHRSSNRYVVRNRPRVWADTCTGDARVSWWV